MIRTWDFEFWNIHQGLDSDYEDPEQVQAAFHSNMDRMVELERIGFEGVFLSEHHFLNALSPCPNLLIAAIAQRTKRLRLGVLGNVLAMHQPFRLAEELAMLDYLTDGRLEIGSAVGIPPEFGFLGIAPQDIRPMYAEVARILELAREGRHVTFAGKYFSYDGLQAMPRPKQVNRRREWVAAYSASSAVTTAKRNAKLALGFQSTAAMAEVFAAYKEAMAAAGHAATADDLMIRRQVLIWDTDEEAAALNSQYMEIAKQLTRKSFESVIAAGRKRGIAMEQAPNASFGIKDAQVVPANPSPAADANPQQGDIFDFVSADEWIFGSPKTVAEKLIEQCRATGAGNIAAYHTAAFREHELAHQTKLWAQVIPILRSADVLPKVA